MKNDTALTPVDWRHCSCLFYGQAGFQIKAPLNSRLAYRRNDFRSPCTEADTASPYGRRKVSGNRSCVGVRRRPDDWHRTCLEPYERIR